VGHEVIMAPVDTIFLAHVFLLQTRMLANFVVRNWRPELERHYGPGLYAFGISGAGCVVLGRP
jgi:hypothetical protein